MIWIFEKVYFDLYINIRNLAYILLLPARRKDSDTEKDRENGLRMNNEMTVKEKRFSFLPTCKKEKWKTDPHLAHCLLPDTQLNYIDSNEIFKSDLKNKTLSIDDLFSILQEVIHKKYGYSLNLEILNSGGEFMELIIMLYYEACLHAMVLEDLTD